MQHTYDITYCTVSGYGEDVRHGSLTLYADNFDVTPEPEAVRQAFARSIFANRNGYPQSLVNWQKREASH